MEITNYNTVRTQVLIPLYRKLQKGEFRDNTVELRDVALYFDPSEEYLDYGSIRPANRKYIAQELTWYLSGDLCINDYPGIVDNAIWKLCATKEGMVNSNYGYLVYNEGNGLQLWNAVKALLEDKCSRQSVCIYNRPEMHNDSKDGIHANHDFTCTMYTQHFIENDNTFNYFVYMRSNDAIFGLQNDYSWHVHVYNVMYANLLSKYPNLKFGQIVWHAGSMHIYDRHYNLLTNIVEGDK